MSWRSVFKGCELSLFIHGTEDEERVVNGVCENLGVRREMLREERLEGHFKNPIVSVKASLQGREAEELVKRILSKLDEESRVKLKANLEDFVDKKGKLYLRLDKQDLLGGRLRLCEQDPVRLVVKPGSRLKKQKFVEEVLGLLKP